MQLDGKSQKNFFFPVRFKILEKTASVGEESIYLDRARILNIVNDNSRAIPSPTLFTN